ncbi:hypothetical protein SDC9_212898 [bioreactor metagenome]|uniref:Uncharacterized protein n=1 Tax=bioreactor metagenome TaxID=1076179 RepID=A0A645JQY5_9ZZZZ
MGHPKITHSSTFADRPIYQGSFGNREEILTAVVQMFDYMWQA